LGKVSRSASRVIRMTILPGGPPRKTTRRVPFRTHLRPRRSMAGGGAVRRMGHIEAARPGIGRGGKVPRGERA
jgi:hypothetical protein